MSNLPSQTQEPTTPVLPTGDTKAFADNSIALAQSLIPDQLAALQKGDQVAAGVIRNRVDSLIAAAGKAADNALLKVFSDPRYTNVRGEFEAVIDAVKEKAGEINRQAQQLHDALTLAADIVNIALLIWAAGGPKIPEAVAAIEQAYKDAQSGAGGGSNGP